MTEPFIIRGADVAAVVYQELSASLDTFAQQGVRPGLAVVLVGDDPASKAYVASKDRKCRELGFHSLKIELPATTPLPDLLARIDQLNRDPAIHGILVQMPLPAHLDEQSVIRAIDPRKDVDGLHPVNLGKLVMEDPTGFAPCTPSGCQRMLQFAGIETTGARVVVLGRSPKPMPPSPSPTPAAGTWPPSAGRRTFSSRPSARRTSSPPRSSNPAPPSSTSASTGCRTRRTPADIASPGMWLTTKWRRSAGRSPRSPEASG
jgi:hypothetical protein